MKYFLLILILAAAVHAGEVVTVDLSRGTVTSRQATPAEIAANEATAAMLASNEAAQAIQPVYVDAWRSILTNGVLYLDADGQHIWHTRTNGIVVDVPVSASPLSNKTYAIGTLGRSNLNAAAAVKAELNLTAAQIAAIKTWSTQDINVVFSNLNAAQRTHLKVMQALLRYLAKKELQEIR